MRALLDECVHRRVKAPGHAVKTVSETGWRSSKDGSLLGHAQAQFDVFVTIDRRLERQHDLENMRSGFVVARVRSNENRSYHPVFLDLLKAVEDVRPGEIIHVVSPRIRVVPCRLQKSEFVSFGRTFPRILNRGRPSSLRGTAQP